MLLKLGGRRVFIGNVVKNVREQQCNQIQFLETYNKEHGNDLAA